MSVEELKKQTISFTVEGHTQLKELTKHHGINQWMMLDALIKSADNEDPALLAEVQKRIDIKEAGKVVDKEIAAALNEATAGMDKAEVLALIQKAKALNE